MLMREIGKFCLMFLLVLAARADAADKCLLILVDGSEQMVRLKVYDAVLSALDTQIKDAKNNRSPLAEWDVEIIAVGISKPNTFSGRRIFSALPLYPSGPGLDSSKRNNRIPNVSESPVTYPDLKGEFHQFLSEKAKLNDGLVIFSDQPEVSQITPKGKSSHRNVLVQLMTTKDSIVPVPDGTQISTEVKACFDEFGKHMASLEKTPSVSVTCLDTPAYVGVPLRFKIEGADLTQAVVSFGDGTPVLNVSGTTLNQTIGHTFAALGDFKVCLEGSRDSKKSESTTIVSVLKKETPTVALPATLPVAKKEHAPIVKATALGEPLYVGDKVSIRIETEHATEVRVGFGDGSPVVKVDASGVDDVGHVYKTDGSFTVEAIARGPGGETTTERRISLVTRPAPPPYVPTPEPVVALFDVETSRGKLAKGEDGGYTVGQGESIDFISNCKNASKYRWDFGDGATPVTERSPTHTYQSDGDYVVTLTASGVADQSTTAKAMIKVSGSSKIPILIVVVCLAIGGLYGLYLISRRPVLSILVSINGQEGAVRQFSLLGHRVALSELSEPLDCRALKVDGLWKVEFRTREERVIEQLPSHSPIRLEAGAWTQALNPGDFCISGRPSEVIRVQDT